MGTLTILLSVFGLVIALCNGYATVLLADNRIGSARKTLIASIVICVLVCIGTYFVVDDNRTTIFRTFGLKHPFLYGAIHCEYNDHHYKAFNESINWLDARERCKKMGGHLATVTSSKEQAFISEICNKQAFYWLGANNDNESRIFKWITGEGWKYDAWLQGQPDDYSGVEDRSVLQFYLSYEPGQDGWDDKELEGDSRGKNSVKNGWAGYVCEWD